MERQLDDRKELKQKREERRDTVANRYRLLQAAETLFHEKGIEVVTMTEIARAAGVGQGTLYRHFTHKGALCATLLQVHIEQFQAEERVHFGQDEAYADPLNRLMLFLTRFAFFIDQHTALLQTMYLANQAHEAENFYRCEMHSWNRERVSFYLQDAMRDGRCRPDLDCDYLADALLAPLQVDLFFYQRHTLGWSVERIAAGLAQLVAGLAQ